MKNNTLRIATRNSPLAMWQAEYVQQQLNHHYPELRIELVPVVTKGDRLLDVSLAKIGGKGLFIKELEHALLDDRADIAVHSMKDVPQAFPEGLLLGVICQREDPRDAFVSVKYPDFRSLPQGAIVGTSSLRRQCQLLAMRPDLQIKMLRGNVNTRLKKLTDGEFDATILAAAGLMRLAMHDHINHCFEVENMLPAAGQGALGIELRAEDEIYDLIQILRHEETTIALTAERAVNAKLGGSCQVPIGAYAQINKGQIHLTALIADPDTNHIFSANHSADCQDAQSLGVAVAEELIAQGAREIVARLI